MLYLPSSRRILSMAYPGPFRRLRDIALGRSPVASATLAGTEVKPSVLWHRFAVVRRVWLVTIRGLQHPPPDSRTDQAKIALIRQLHLVGRWHAGAVVLSLYARAAHHVGDGLPCSQHLDRHPSSSLAKLAADIETVDLRQPDVPDDRIEVALAGHQTASLPLAWTSTAYPSSRNARCSTADIFGASSTTCRRTAVAPARCMHA